MKPAGQRGERAVKVAGKDLILKVKGVNKSFSGTKAVNDVSFEVFSGEIMGLLGPNGAGKTTVIRMIMGIFAPDSGRIEFQGGLKMDKRKFGYLPEERGIYDNTGVLDTILYFAGLKGMDRTEAREEALKWLEILGLKGYARNKVEELSKGMQQKVQFIVSIVHKPDLLVLDEVFAGLDPVNQDLFKEIISRLAAGGTTILLSSHRMNMVEELCDRIFLINHGSRVLYGRVQQIKDDFGERKVHLSSRGDLDKMKILRSVPWIRGLEKVPGGFVFNLPAEISPREFLNSLPDDMNIEELSIVRPALHEIFVRTVGRGAGDER